MKNIALKTNENYQKDFFFTVTKKVLYLSDKKKTKKTKKQNIPQHL